MTQVYPDASELYLDLLKKCLTRCIFETIYRPISPRKATLPIRKLAAYFDIELVKCVDPSTRAEGRDWPTDGETMIGLQRLDNLQYCVTDVLRRGIPGDFIETGVWRGGATILMRAVLKAYGDTERTVWVADSFQGCPKPDPARYQADAGDRHWTFTPLIVSPEEVKANFARYGLLDDQVRFLVGWFRDTLPTAPIERLAVLRLDGDMYESTMDALRHLYPKLSIGGYVIIDDYSLPGCKAAVEDFRTQHGITEERNPVDRLPASGVFWRKLR